MPTTTNTTMPNTENHLDTEQADAAPVDGRGVTPLGPCASGLLERLHFALTKLARGV